MEPMIHMEALTSFRLCLIPERFPASGGQQNGQGEKEKFSAQLVHTCRRQVAEAAFEGKNARTENREADEKVRRVFAAEGLEARHRPWPSAMSAVL